MKVDEELLDHVAKTARLELTDEEKNEFLPQLKQIIDAFSEIQKVDAKKTEPSYHPVKLEGTIREDRPKDSISNELALKNSRKNKDGYIKGPKVL